MALQDQLSALWEENPLGIAALLGGIGLAIAGPSQLRVVGLLGAGVGAFSSGLLNDLAGNGTSATKANAVEKGKDRAESELKNQVSALKDRVDNLSRQLAKQGKTDEVTTDLQNIRDKISALESEIGQISSIKEQVSSLKTKVAKTANDQPEMSNLNDKFQSLRDELSQIRQRPTTSPDRIAQLEQAVDSIQGKLSQIENLEAELADLSSQVRNSETTDQGDMTDDETRSTGDFSGSNVPDRDRGLPRQSRGFV